MHSWEVVAINRDGTDNIDDCSSITEIAFLVAKNLRTEKVETANIMIHQGHKRWHVSVGGDRYDLQPVERDDVRYVRTLDEDSTDDPLLRLPSISEFEKNEQMKKRFGES